MFFLLSLVAQAQEKPQNLTVFVNDDIESYLSKAGNQAIIYSGKEEVKYPTHIINHPYVDTKEYRKGNLSFDGIMYPNVRMRLNSHTGELIVINPDSRYNLVVPTDRVDYATIDSLYIFYLQPDNEYNLREGYYVRLRNGKHPVLKRQTSFLKSRTKDLELEVSFDIQKRFYVLKDGVYTQVNSQRGILKLFKSHKKELKQYIKQHEINFRESPEKAILAITEQYEILSPL